MQGAGAPVAGAPGYRNQRGADQEDAAEFNDNNNDQGARG